MKRLVTLTAILALAACGGESRPAAPRAADQPRTPARSPATEPRTGEMITLSDGMRAAYWGKIDVRGKTTIRVVMADAPGGGPYFSPTILIGSPGQRIRIEVVNKTAEGHPFNLPAQGINAAVDPGGKRQVTVQFPASGAVTFSCPHTGHAGELRTA